MRLVYLLVSGILLALVLLPACGGDEEEPATSASPSSPAATLIRPSPRGTPSAGFDAFRVFAREMEAAIATRDTEFFASRGVEMDVTCRGDEQLGPCTDKPAGTVLRGIPGAAWKSDAFGLTPRTDFSKLLQDWYSAALPGLANQYGSGSPVLYALAEKRDSGESYAIATEILQTGPATGIQRQARVFRFSPVAGQWQLNGEILAAVSLTADDWLSGNCGECYDYWELWEGAAH